MERKAISAVFLTLIMLLSGCLGSDGTEGEVIETETQQEITASFTLYTDSNPAVGEIVFVDGIAETEPIDAEYFIEYDIITPSGIRPIEATISETDTGMRLILMPDEPGQWKIIGRMIVTGLDDSLKSEVDFEVLPPDEGETILSVDSIIEMDFSAPLTISGKVIHSNPSSCTIEDGSNSQSANDAGEFYLGQGVVEESYNVTIIATCGIWTESQDSRTVRVILSEGNDMDGDGIPDDSDACPNGYGEDEGWNPNQATDRDGDGCHDFEEDIDDDNDGFIDILDRSPKYSGFVPDQNLLNDDRSKASTSGSTIAGNKALLLLFTTTISMGLILGARKFVNKKTVSHDNQKRTTDLTLEELI